MTKPLRSIPPNALFSRCFLYALCVCGFLPRGPIGLAVELPTPRFEPQLVGNLEKGYGLSTGDVDGDGKLDILLADRWTFVWFRNGDWKRFVLADRLDGQKAMSIEARDIDGDGRVEIAICTQAPRARIYWLERPEDPTQLWNPVKLPSEPNQHRMRWARDFSGKQNIISVPLFAGVEGSGTPVKVYAYDMSQSSSGRFPRRLLVRSMSDMHDFAVVKGRPGGPERLFLIGLEGVELMGNSEKKPWAPDGVKRLPGMTTSLGEIDEGRTPARTFLAIAEPKHGNRVVIYPADQQGKYGNQRLVLDETLKVCHALECEDVLGIGRDQVIAGWWGDEHKRNYGIRLYVPLNDEATDWKTVSVDQGMMACQSMQIADIDGDGRLDIIAAGWTTKNLVVYWNRTEPVPQQHE